MTNHAKNIIILDSVDSTNNYAMGMIRASEINEQIAIFAREQTRGKGRRGKEWESNKNENIILTIPVQMQWLPISHQFELSVAVSLGCFDFCGKYVLSNLFIKWPNDLFINDSKAGGILIENKINGNKWQWALIGIGININQEQFKKSINSATSLKNETGRKYDTIKLAEELFESVLKRIDELKNGNFKTMLVEYNQQLYAREKWVKLKKGNQIYETQIISVSAVGELITKDEAERKFIFDEVDFLGKI